MDKRIIAALVALLLLVLGMAVGPAGVALMMVTSAVGAQAANAASACGGSAADGAVVPTGPARLPLAGSYSITSEYGMRLHPVLNVWKLHAGIDFVTIPHGGPILAAKAGVVKTAQPNDPAAGNFMEIDNGGGVITRYLHMARFEAKVGDKVVAGQQIGLEGGTGRVTGPHLHFEVKVNGAATDPRVWLTGQGLALPATHGTAVAPGPVDPSTAGTGAISSGLVTGTPAPTASPTIISPTPLPSGSAPAPSGTASPVVAGLPARVGQWSGEQVVNAAKIIKAARGRGVGTWETTLAVNVAMSESSLQNISHGDAARNDTIGLFQEGPERGPYEKRMDPAGATEIFLDYLLKVPNYRSMAPTIAAHKAQANADPYHYQQLWNDAVVMVSTLTADPNLLKNLPVGGGGSAPCDPSLAAADVPGLPSGPCPASNSPAEAGLQPAGMRVLRCGAHTFPFIKTMYGVGQRPAGTGDHHATGRAVDFMIDNYRTPEGRASGWQVANWMRAHAKELGIHYVIFDVKIWNIQRDAEGWRDYHYPGAAAINDTTLHKDHVHVSVY